MIDFGSIVGFDWDEGNIRKSADKHGVDFREAEQVFLDPRLLILVDEEHGGEKKRFHAYGQSAAGRLLLVSFTLRQRETLIRVISARNMSRKERQRYAEES
ncbi:MAG: BrnT family toxin [Pseudolabrys sp.]|jgi:uncharacterized protein